jgi:hypothetical protein
MILAYVNESSAYVTASLYKGLINVVLWKIVAAILGVLMLKLITSNQVGEDWATSFSFIAINLCVGLSLLFVPFTTKSLIGDGLNSAASGLAAAPAYAAFGAAKIAAKTSLEKTKNAALFSTRPFSNYLQRKMTPVTSRINQAKETWGQIGKAPENRSGNSPHPKTSNQKRKT